MVRCSVGKLLAQRGCKLFVREIHNLYESSMKQDETLVRLYFYQYIFLKYHFVLKVLKIIKFFNSKYNF